MAGAKVREDIRRLFILQEFFAGTRIKRLIMQHYVLQYAQQRRRVNATNYTSDCASFVPRNATVLSDPAVDCQEVQFGGTPLFDSVLVCR